MKNCQTKFNTAKKLVGLEQNEIGKGCQHTEKDLSETASRE